MTPREKRIHSAVTALVAASKSVDPAALAARSAAQLTLESLGFSEWEVIEARAQAQDGFSVKAIVEALTSEETVSA